jgi:outer membrane biosynthesis protein TonB
MRLKLFLTEHGPAVGAGVAAVVIIGIAATLFFSSDSHPAKKVPEVMMVKLQPLPPPPPPPPPPKIEQPKMVEQTPVKVPEPQPDKPQDKPKAEPPKADAPPPGPLALDAKGEGPGDAFNLGGRPGGNGLLGGEGGGGSRWGWYAAIVQGQIEDAMRKNKKTRNSQARVELRLWCDALGHIERVQLAGSSSDSDVDQAIEHEVLDGMTLRQPPPKDMPMPIVVRMTARRPS